MRLDVRCDSIDVFELLLAERAGEVLRGVYRGVVDELVLSTEAVVALLAAELVRLAERPATCADCLAVF